MPDEVKGFPLFLLGIVALPGESVPLHVFEDRYRHDDRGVHARRSGSSASCGLLTGSSSRSAARAEIEETLERMDDGRLNILARGTRPFRLLERQDDLPYPAGADRVPRR